MNPVRPKLGSMKIAFTLGLRQRSQTSSISVAGWEIVGMDALARINRSTVHTHICEKKKKKSNIEANFCDLLSASKIINDHYGEFYEQLRRINFEKKFFFLFFFFFFKPTKKHPNC